MSLRLLIANFTRLFSTENMSIELQSPDSLLVKANGISATGANGANTAVRPGGTFGEVLSSQAALFKMDDGKQNLNSAKLLSPDVVHANQLLSQSKTYSQLNSKSIHAFEANIHQAEYILAMKNIAEYKQSTAGGTLTSTIDKLGRNISGINGSSPLYSAANSLSQGTLRALNTLKYKSDEHALNGSRNLAVEAEEVEEARETEAAELLAKDDDSGHGQFFKDSSSHRNPHDQASEEPSADELEVVGALTMSSGNCIQDLASRNSGAIQLQMQSSLSSPEWITELAQKTIVMFGSDKHTAVITLNSVDKGSLKIILHIKGDQVSVNFHSNDSEVLQALQMGSSDLKSSMLEAGLILSHLHIGSSSSYQANEAVSRAEPDSIDNEPDLTDLNSAKIVNFYV